MNVRSEVSILWIQESPTLSSSPAQGIRPFGDGRGSVKEGGKERYCRLDTGHCSRSEAKNSKTNRVNAQSAEIGNNTNRGGRKVAEHEAHGASRGLGEARVTEPDLLEQESIVTEHRGGTLRICVRRDRVSLEIVG